VRHRHDGHIGGHRHRRATGHAADLGQSPAQRRVLVRGALSDVLKVSVGPFQLPAPLA